MIDTNSKWRSISAGSFHSLAIKNDGTLWSWGFNGNGQVGDTTNFNKPSPVQITAATNWQSISAGYQFSTAIKTNGSIFSWGFNGNGQLGDNTTTQRNFPLDISAAETWNSISAGASFAYAIKSDSTLYAWGFNGAGQLGSGNITQYNKPTLVDNATNWLTINAADGGQSGAQVFGLHALGLKSNRFGICYSGANYTGQLGDGTTANSSVFVCNQITTGVEEFLVEQFEISIYPNPTSDFITLEIPRLDFETISYSIINSLGQQVISEKASRYSQIDLSTLDNGLYLIVLSKESQTITTARIIKN